MKFMVATLALFCVIAYANAGFGRSKGPPRSTGPTFPRGGGSRWRREAEPVEVQWQDSDTNINLPEDSIRIYMVPDQPIVYGWNAGYKHRRDLDTVEFEEEEY